jgi:hypothetical protein
MPANGRECTLCQLSNTTRISLVLACTHRMQMNTLVRDALAIFLLALCQSLELRKKAEPDVELGA